MKNKTTYSDQIKSLLVLILLFSFVNCSKSRINANVDENTTSIYANPETIQFSTEHYQLMLKQTYLKLGYEYPPDADYNAVKNAATMDEAKTAYNIAIENMVNSGVLKDGLLDFFTQILGVGNPSTETDLSPAYLGVYTVLKGKPMKDFLLFKGAYDEDGTTVTQTYVNGPPTSSQAGYITTQPYFSYWANAFFFKHVREAYVLNLCVKAPFSNVGLNRWSLTEINPKYVQATNNSPTQCEACHTVLNIGRGAFHGYEGTTLNWTGAVAQGTNQYGQEPTGVLEPLNSNGTPLGASAAAALYKLTENGSPFATPQEWAQRISEHENFAGCWTQRLMTFALGLDPGSPGASPIIPNYFSTNEAGAEFLEQQTTKFKDLGQKPKDYLIYFLQSPYYLVTGYIDPNAGATP